MKDSSKDNQLRSRLGTTVKQIKMPEHLRFCPICVENDRKEYNETYWHRLCQLPGILVCPFHSCFLENSSVKWERGIGSHFYSAEECVSLKKPRLLKKTSADHQKLISLAGNAEWLLSQNHISIGNSEIRGRYYNQLLKNELAYYNGRIRNNKLYKAFQNYYSPSLLKALGCSIESSHRSWIFRIVEKSKTGIIHHPVRHLLMMIFLGFTAKEFFTSFVEYKPFIDPPYPCLNRASNHYAELRIHRSQVFDNLTKGERRGKPIAIFACDCGFIYQRIGPDKSEYDRFRYDSIREYGTLWEKKLKEMWNDLSLSREEIARRLKISSLSVSNIARRLNFPMNTMGTRISNDKAHRKQPRKTLSEAKEIYRKRWLEILKANPTASRNKLIKLANFEYLWLMRNETKWMRNHLPNVMKVPRQKRILDWEKIDEELLMKIQSICDEICSEIPLARVSITEIIKRTGCKKWIEKRHIRLPKTTLLIDQNLESLEDYMLRKLKLAEKQLSNEKRFPTRHQLIQRAVIRNLTTNNSPKIQHEITKCLNRLEILLMS